MYKLFSDGGARGNPGPAGIGFVIYKDEEVIEQGSKYIGETTNNQAEYQAILAGLEKAKALGIKELVCFLDSELVVKQLNRQYKVKEPGLASLFVKVWNLLPSFKSVKIQHVYREKNVLADKLVNEAIDLAKVK